MKDYQKNSDTVSKIEELVKGLWLEHAFKQFMENGIHLLETDEEVSDTSISPGDEHAFHWVLVHLMRFDSSADEITMCVNELFDALDEYSDTYSYELQEDLAEIILAEIKKRGKNIDTTGTVDISDYSISDCSDFNGWCVSVRFEDVFDGTVDTTYYKNTGEDTFQFDNVDIEDLVRDSIPDDFPLWDMLEKKAKSLPEVKAIIENWKEVDYVPDHLREEYEDGSWPPEETDAGINTDGIGTYLADGVWVKNPWW